MDEIAQYNIDRWDALARARAVFTRPRLDLTAYDAQMLVDPERRFGEIAGKQVLCLAGGGGQQSAAFALLGAVVTVFDLSVAQLQRDRQAAVHYNLQVRTEQGDMRDLARFEPAAFDLVIQPYSINFVPDARRVFGEVARVTRASGKYYFMCANPFFSGLAAADWDGHGYPLNRPYVDGMQINYRDEPWVFRGELPREPIQGPREFRHTLATLINGLIDAGFAIQRLAEDHLGILDASAVPGTEEHFSAMAPLWLEFWAARQPVGMG